jgi:hypothetical protein
VLFAAVLDSQRCVNLDMCQDDISRLVQLSVLKQRLMGTKNIY